ncbi:MAG: alpha/beta hydrolase [Asgard group archaeon]|nr:alpha/beta hydrolase [Asgard group archaeon]
MPYVNNEGVKIYYVVEGQGEPMIMIHGGPGTHHEWNGYVQYLRDKYQLIRFDLRGNGQSDKPHDPEAYRTTNYTSDIIAVLDELNIDKVHCWGYSLGGYLAFCLSRDDPERFLSYIIGGNQPQEPTEEVKEYRKTLDEKVRKGADGLLDHLRERGDNVTPGVEDFIRAMDFKAINAWIDSPDFFTKVDDHLPELEEPFLFYAGEDDEWNPYPQLLETSKKMKNAKAILFEKKGHTVHFEIGIILPHVLKFLESI